LTEATCVKVGKERSGRKKGKMERKEALTRLT